MWVMSNRNGTLDLCIDVVCKHYDTYTQGAIHMYMYMKVY